MPASICCNRHAQDFALFGEPCPECGALLRFRTRYVSPEGKARRVGCLVRHATIPEVETAVNFYEFSLRDGFARNRLAKRLAALMTRQHPVWADDAATDAAFALTLCRDEIERDAHVSAERRRARRQKRKEQLSGV